MCYGDFTLSRLVKQFSLTVEETTDLYSEIASVAIRPEFESHLSIIATLGLNVATDKARSEFIIAPILTEFWLLTNRQVGLHSGVDFTVEPENGLVGICDYIVTRSPEQFYISAPVILLVEAKNEDMKRGYGQCIAEMIAAQRFNERENVLSDKIYGAVTIGERWKFLELEQNIVRIDAADYYIKDLGKIVGILLHMAARSASLTV